MILLLCGEDSYRLKERLHELLNGFKKKYDPAGLNLLRISGETAGVGEVREALRSAGFLGSRRMVVIDGLFSAGRAEEFRDIFQNAGALGDDILILCENLPKSEMMKSDEFQTLTSGGARLEEFAPLYGLALSSWIRAEVKKNGNTIDNEAVAILCERVGSDLWSLRTELLKLSAYAFPGAIAKKHVDTLLQSVAEENIFEFLDAIFSRNGERAALVLHRELEASGPQLLISMLMKQLRNLIMIHSLKLENKSLSEAAIAKETGIHPYVVKKAVLALQNFPIQELNFLWDNVLQIDKKIKSGFKKPEVMFDLLIARAAKV